MRAESGRLGVRSLAALSLTPVLLAAFAALLILPLQAQAQTLTTFVSNTGERVTPNSTNSIVAQSFETGANAGEFTISEVQLRIDTASGGRTAVRIRGNNNNRPGGPVAILKNPRVLKVGLNTFTAPAGTTLAGGKTYWITVSEGVGSSRPRFAHTSADGETGETGWSIGNTRLYKTNTTANWSTAPSSLLIAIKGTNAFTDATLSDLTLEDGDGNAITLSPVFPSDELEHEAAVGKSVSRITVTPTKSEADATIDYLDGDDNALTDVDTVTDGHQVDLTAGENTIKVRVTAEDTTTTQTYTVQVTADTPATGAPVITGRTELGQTLTAEITGISDAGGTTKADAGDTGYAYTYQWERVDADGSSNPLDIPGATESTYTVISLDVGSRIRVKVSFTDDAGNSEEPPASNALPTGGTVSDDVWYATLYVQPLGGGVRGCGNSSPGDHCSNTAHLTEDEFTHASTDYSVTTVQIRSNGQLRLWMGPNIAADSKSLVLHVGSETFAFQEADEKGVRSRYWNNTGLSWSNDDAVELKLTGSSLTRAFNETLGDAVVATASDIGDAVTATATDAGDTLSYSLEGPDAGRFEIIRASGQIQTKVGERYDYEEQSSYEVTVRVMDGNGGSATIDVTLNVRDVDERPLPQPAPAVSGPTGNSTNSLVVRMTAPDNLGRPAITGYKLRVRRALANFTWYDYRFSYRPNAVQHVFGLASGRRYEVQFRVKNGEGEGPWSPSGYGHTKAHASGRPTIAGTAEVGQTLMVETSRISDRNGNSKAEDGEPDFAYTYQWVRVDGSTKTDISGATASTYTLTTADLYKTVKVKVRFTDNAEYDEGPLTSAAYPSSGTVTEKTDPPATGAPAIMGVPQVDKTLTAGTSGIMDADGLSGSLTYQWVRVDSDGTSNEANIGLNSSTYTVAAADVGKKIKVKVSFTDDAGNPEGPLTSDAYPSDGTVLGAAGACPTGSDWCAMLTVEADATFGNGYDDNPSFGNLDDTSFDHGGTTYTISEIRVQSSSDAGVKILLDAFLPHGAVFNLGGTEFTTDAASETSHTARYSWTIPTGFAWIDGQMVTVSLKLPSADLPGVSVSKTALRVTEEDTTGETYTVVLDSQPTANVVVTVAGHAGTEVTPNPTSLTFTTSNWNMDQTVAVTAGDDADTENDTVTLTHSAASMDSGYDGITIDGVTVTVNDDDTSTAGICGRTPAVRDALVELIPGVSDCAAVTAADLAAITGTLDLYGQSIAGLKAGDFAGLTKLRTLYLDNNGLTELPDEVFAGLTALKDLYLNNNELTTLPGGVFAGLTRLKVLTLYHNALLKLPDGVFEPLIALEALYPSDNPGAPFAPTADARPDAGTVPVAGGTVRLDGSGSGGAWGTNVSYSWALTNPVSGVTFDDATSATPEVTIPELPAGTEITFTLTVTGRGGTEGIATATDTANVTATASTASTASGEAKR